jgi:hypothetical protein
MVVMTETGVSRLRLGASARAMRLLSHFWLLASSRLIHCLLFYSLLSRASAVPGSVFPTLLSPVTCSTHSRQRGS